MRSNVHSIRLEVVAYLVIVLAGSYLRLADLQWPPLSDTEARGALAASALAGSPSPFDSGMESPAPGSSYAVGTALLFQLFGSTDVAARVLPALAGVALCLLPLLGRGWLGPKRALSLAALLSFSPVMVTISRQGGGASLACLGVTGFLLLAFGERPAQPDTRRTGWALGFAALALASGPEWVQGFIGIAPGVGFTMAWLRRQGETSSSPQWLSFSRRNVVLGLLVLLAIATGVGMVPGRAADTFESLGVWLSALSAPSGMSALSALLVIPIYEPLLLVFGIYGAAGSFRRKDALGVGAAFWALAALVVAAVYPGRSALDLAWVAIPTAYLAAGGVIRLIEALMNRQDWLRFAGMTGAFLVLAAFIGLQLTGYVSGLGLEFAILDPGIRLGIIFVAILIWIVLVFLFGTGWSWAESGTAAGFSILGVLTAVSFASMVRLNFVRQAAEGGQLWRSRVAAVGLHELANSLDFLSRAYLDDPGGITVSVQGEVPASLAWTLRGFQAEAVSTTDQVPPVVLAHADAEPVLRADYLGQRLAIAETNDWKGTLPPDLLSWLVLHRAPVAFDDWVLLVRADVATQGGLTALGSETNP